MELTLSQYNAIMRIYGQRRLLARDRLLEKKKEIYTAIPELAAIDEQVAALAVKRAKQLIAGQSEAHELLRQEIASLRKRKEELLALHGYTTDDLEEHYECSDCKDTGYIGNRKCHCFKKEINALLLEESSLKDVLETENFDHFDFSWYSDNYLSADRSFSSLQSAKAAYHFCRRFCDTFGEEYHNIFLYGDVGVGKTFLSHCVARSLLDRGLSVLYFSASSFFDVLAKAAFEKEETEKNDIDALQMFEYIFTCDLLIIDDLGTELVNRFVSSEFFTVLNERMLKKRPVFISTNLGIDAIKTLYSERIFSRISSGFTLLKMIGDDIRIKKKIMERF